MFFLPLETSYLKIPQVSLFWMCICCVWQWFLNERTSLHTEFKLKEHFSAFHQHMLTPPPSLGFSAHWAPPPSFCLIPPPSFSLPYKAPMSSLVSVGSPPAAACSLNGWAWIFMACLQQPWAMCLAMISEWGRTSKWHFSFVHASSMCQHRAQLGVCLQSIRNPCSRVGLVFVVWSIRKE